MDVLPSDVAQALFRWIHVVAGITWIGFLYFFNLVNSAFVPTLDADTKKKVIPQLLPRALFWFRWGALWTWATGLVLLMIVFYHQGLLLENPSSGWSVGTIVMVLSIYPLFFVYDVLMKGALGKNLMASAVVGIVVVSLMVLLMIHWGGFSYRGYMIHVGAMFGTIMALNVWMRIWPAQQKIVTAIRDGQPPDAGLVALAGLRSKHNTYLSIPLIWTMINAHNTFASSTWVILPLVILIGWHGVSHLYKKAAKVQGF